MTNTESVLRAVTSQHAGEQDRPIVTFSGRESQELVVAFSGPLGCGIETVVEAAKTVLRDAGYEVIVITLSDYIEEALSSGVVAPSEPAGQSAAAIRYNRLQSGGDDLRQKLGGNEILAEWAVTQIAVTRTEGIEDRGSAGALERHIPEKRAFLIDQLKHPAEVELLRAVYRNLFFLVGVLSVTERRRSRLSEKGMSQVDAEQTMARDRREPAPHGQHLDKTLEKADFFIRNDRPNIEETQRQIGRFIELMHGASGVSPKRDEFGMYVAYASSLASGCLSRQVGAAILDASGNVLGVGCNDVPKPRGGLYTAEDGADDARCVKKEGKRCWNDFYKQKLREQLASELSRAGGVERERAAQIASALYEHTAIKDLIEYSRAVHAEMEAIISVARKGSSKIEDGILYTTTFPCHSCARHIVAAGLRRVIYIEPYEKSLALELHGDSITLENAPGDHNDRGGRVEFLHFEGVAPRRYVSMFLPRGERKRGGVAVVDPLRLRPKAAPEYLDNYRQFELKVVDHWNSVAAPTRSVGRS